MLQTTAFSTFWPHGTKLGHSWYQWIIKIDFSGWFDNSKKGEVSGQIEWMGGWSRGCSPPKESCRLPPTYFWATWHQTRAFLKSVINKKWFFWLVWQFWKRRGVWADWVDVRLIPRLHSTSGMLQTTAYPLFWPHGTKLGHSWFQWIMKSDFWLVWQFWKRRGVWALWVDVGEILWLHSI